jgi:DNA-binding HxlR family transcriptional regulator
MSMTVEDQLADSAPALSRALKQLASAQIVTRVPYRLTPAGEDLLPVVMSLHLWGNKRLRTEILCAPTRTATRHRDPAAPTGFFQQLREAIGR